MDMDFGVGSYEMKNILSALASLARYHDAEELSDLPMNQYTSSGVEALLDEGIAGGEMLNDVLVFHVVDLDDMVVEIHEEMIIERQPQH
ncbi:hypothetical protein HO133_010595 [Letharia lupina]|uniref:Uncharacterized protein n=1 Tax=Letharia lupina TaxID=560253 RepID=A0A8H6CIU2_9LECA|nr:uncharacterized protein HO133_010595 [Letharia lupina]KAF6224021.1 hypothetical protein HO133_010595 [Letharia lupina]